MKAAAIAMVAGAPMLQTCSRSATSQASPLPSSQPSPTPGLRAAAGALVDENGNEVCLTGVSWFGFETSTFAPHGLWARGWQDLLDQILASGFNLLRLPFCNQVLDERRMPNSIDYAKNPDLRNLTSLEVMDRIVAGAGERRMRVLLDRHRPTADEQSELWYTEATPEARWIRDWVSLAQRYHEQPAVIGTDLHNEPHGRATWGDGNTSTDWRNGSRTRG
jgi:endoglucanase